MSLCYSNKWKLYLKVFTNVLEGVLINVEDALFFGVCGGAIKRPVSNAARVMLMLSFRLIHCVALMY